MPIKPNPPKVTQTRQRIHAAEERARADAAKLALRAAAGLRLAAARAGGADGLALACALVDMIRAGTAPAG
jgi:hypothetical protein